MKEDDLLCGVGELPYTHTQEFSLLLKENEELLLQAVNAPAGSRAVFITGSGTAAMEAAVTNIFGTGDRLLVVKGGSFGERFSEICDCAKLPHENIELPPGKQIKEEYLGEYENCGYTGMLVNVLETSTGLLYDMEIIKTFCRRNGILLLADAAGTFLADRFDMSGIRTDAVTLSSQKGLALPPGLSMVILNGKAADRIREYNSKGITRNYYLNLSRALTKAEEGQTPFTPAVSILIQLNARLRRLKSEGPDKTISETSKIAGDFRRRIKNYPFIISAENLSNAVTPLLFNGCGMPATELFETLKEDYGILTAPVRGKYKDVFLRVGHIGDLTLKDNDKLFDALRELREKKLI